MMGRRGADLELGLMSMMADGRWLKMVFWSFWASLVAFLPRQTRGFSLPTRMARAQVQPIRAIWATIRSATQQPQRLNAPVCTSTMKFCAKYIPFRITLRQVNSSHLRYPPTKFQQPCKVLQSDSVFILSVGKGYTLRCCWSHSFMAWVWLGRSLGQGIVRCVQSYRYSLIPKRKSCMREGTD